jgi:DNA-binding NtrC family response regulator
MERSYLLVFAAGSARLVPLPAEGGAWLRRSPEGGVEAARDPDGALARLTADGVLEPLGGPVTLNDRPLEAPGRLTSGDVLALDGVHAVFHRDPALRPPRRVLAAGDLAERLRQEAERARRYRRPLGVLVVALGAPVDARDVAEAALQAVRLSDIVGFATPVELVVALPESGDSATVPARRILDALRPLAPAARGGLALLPGDGDDADALLTGARRAAESAAAGAVARVHADHLRLAGDVEIVAVDPKMRGLLAFVRDLARSDLPLLVTGETGVGKDLVARAAHAWSPRAGRRFVSFNCAALPDSLLESELFGHKQGAFSGATSDRVGLLESAAGGTVFLDEVGECTARAQAELLRVLDGGSVRPVGATAEKRVDLRVVAATNRDLEAESKAGRFRRDLYFRLGAARVVVPPLRERPLDVAVLARHFLDAACADLGRPAPALGDDVLLRLQRHAWPGNVRELRNVMRYLAAIVSGPVVEGPHLPAGLSEAAAPWRDRRDATPPPEGAFRPLADEIRDLERRRLAQALAAAEGVRVRAAALIGMPLRTFASKIKEYRLDGRELS